MSVHYECSLQSPAGSGGVVTKINIGMRRLPHSSSLSSVSLSHLATPKISPGLLMMANFKLDPLHMTGYKPNLPVYAHSLFMFWRRMNGRFAASINNKRSSIKTSPASFSCGSLDILGMLQSPSITQNCTVELSPWCFCIPVSKCIFWLRNDWLLTATHLVFYSKTSLLEKCGVYFLFPHLLKTPPRLTHTSALTLRIDFSLLPSSCKLPETWRRVFAAILGHTENQHQVKDGDCTRDSQ